MQAQGRQALKHLKQDLLATFRQEHWSDLSRLDQKYQRLKAQHSHSLSASDVELWQQVDRLFRQNLTLSIFDPCVNQRLL